MQLHRDRDAFEEAGVELAVIGQGTPRQARAFKDDRELDFRLLVDPKRATYRAVGAKKASVGELLGPRLALRAARAVASERVVQGRTVGHPAQLGGVLVVVPGGEIVWSHLANDAGDNPPNERVLEAARAAAEAA